MYLNFLFITLVSRLLDVTKTWTEEQMFFIVKVLE
jgi:hypothetical protein